jgi:putative Mg2+ transporter-C (MgtC) family protein
MMQSLISPDTLDAALRLGSAVAIGGLVGLDRGLRQKPAGLRTHALVSLGAALMTYTGIELAPAEPSAVTRVLQGVIAGVGFLGGGVILRDAQDLRIRGLTTAASIWIVAGLGMASRFVERGRRGRAPDAGARGPRPRGLAPLGGAPRPSALIGRRYRARYSAIPDISISTATITSSIPISRSSAVSPRSPSTLRRFPAK